MNSETVAAVSTPPGRSAIGLIRITGPDAIKILDSVCKFATNKFESSKLEPRKVYKCILHDNSLDVDEVLITIFRNPGSYTGEDMSEISCHGNPYIIIKIMEILMEKGIKPAGPGEFTKRAFLNGKMDLSQAEAVADIINADSQSSLSMALSQLCGSEKKAIINLKNNLMNLLAELELGIDFTDEQHPVISSEEAVYKAEKISELILEMINNSSTGLMIKNGIKTVICGAPNAGKSSLLNALLKKERAIVNAIPGTTRDIIEETLEINGLPFKLIDTAGIRETNDPIEQEGVKRALNQVHDADIIIFTVDASCPSFIDMPPKKNGNIIVAANKSDITGSVDSESICRKLGVNPDFGINVSALTGKGIDLLKQKAYSFVAGDNKAFDPAKVTVCNLRHKQALENALTCIDSAVSALKSEMSFEFPAADIKRAADFIAEITGEITGNDILENIFSKFCIGK